MYTVLHGRGADFPFFFVSATGQYSAESAA